MTNISLVTYDKFSIFSFSRWHPSFWKTDTNLISNLRDVLSFIENHLKLISHLRNEMVMKYKLLSILYKSYTLYYFHSLSDLNSWPYSILATPGHPHFCTSSTMYLAYLIITLSTSIPSSQSINIYSSYYLISLTLSLSSHLSYFSRLLYPSYTSLTSHLLRLATSSPFSHFLPYYTPPFTSFILTPKYLILHPSPLHPSSL